MVASCWAIGRNSAEATKALLMRAVRAALAALFALLTGFLARALAFNPSDDDLSLGAPALVGFFVALVLDEDDRVDFDVEPVEVCPATGSTTRRRARA
jgi:hypothetical protein